MPFLGRALANVTTIGLLQQRAIHHREVVAEQLQGALNSRVVIEQAKGVLFERLEVDMHDALRNAPQLRPAHQPPAQ